MYQQHAKRLYPLQISPKVPIEWGYVAKDDTLTDETNDNDVEENEPEEDGNDRIRNWVTVDKAVLDSIPGKGIEKQMGFVGTPDPTTGFYCVSVVWVIQFVSVGRSLFLFHISRQCVYFHFPKQCSMTSNNPHHILHTHTHTHISCHIMSFKVYNEGRLVKSTDGSSSATRPSSKKIA